MNRSQEISSTEYRQLMGLDPVNPLAKPKKRHKYSAKKTIGPGGRWYDSKAEAALADLLFAAERAGEIRDLKSQVEVRLSKADILYKPDFSFTDAKTGQKVWAEMKGFETAVWRIKRRLWIAYGPGPLKIYKVKNGAPFLYEELECKSS